MSFQLHCICIEGEVGPYNHCRVIKALYNVSVSSTSLNLDFHIASHNLFPFFKITLPSLYICKWCPGDIHLCHFLASYFVDIANIFACMYLLV